MEAVADTVVARWFTPAFAAARPDVVAPIRADLAATPPEGYAACCEVVGAMDLRADLRLDPRGDARDRRRATTPPRRPSTPARSRPASPAPASSCSPRARTW